ncbi:MAG: hypothetical protein ACYC2K_10135 [Gemmatimonadales bacterium]
MASHTSTVAIHRAVAGAFQSAVTTSDTSVATRHSIVVTRAVSVAVPDNVVTPSHRAARLPAPAVAPGTDLAFRRHAGR